MLFFYVRHGNPIYNPDQLTPLGRRQAEALAKRLAVYGLDRIYASTSTRAIQTAEPTCELLQKEMTLLDFAHERYAGRDLDITHPDGRRGWVFDFPDIMRKIRERKITEPDEPWDTLPEIKEYHLQKGVDRIAHDADEFLLSLGYKHIKGTGFYKVIKPNNERVALFAHAGFGLAFLSSILDIPYPDFTTHFDLSHSSLTVIEFREENGYTAPKICTFSSDSHIYREGLPTEYNFRFKY